MIVVSVDQRERNSSIARRLAARRDLRVQVVQLKSADYALGRAVGIERKTGDDFARSIVDGRLFRQLSLLKKSYARALLLVERLAPSCPTAGVPWHAIRGALVSAAAVFGVPILPSSGPDESADMILDAARQFQRGFEDGYVRPGYRPKGWRRRALFVLQGFPGIGPARAAALLDSLGSVKAVVNADEPSLIRVPGIGRAVARGIAAAAGRAALSFAAPPR